MVGKVAGRIVDHADARLADLLGAPGRLACGPRVHGWPQGRPVGCGERVRRGDPCVDATPPEPAGSPSRRVRRSRAAALRSLRRASRRR
ncbi:hypothetical protein ACFPRL_33215 [Pseudoclavibacter helvolus]